MILARPLSSLARAADRKAWPASSGVAKTAGDGLAVVSAGLFIEQLVIQRTASRTRAEDCAGSPLVKLFLCDFICFFSVLIFVFIASISEMLLAPSAPAAAAATFAATTAEATMLATTFPSGFRMHAGTATFTLGAFSPAVATHAIASLITSVGIAPAVVTGKTAATVASFIGTAIGSEPSAVRAIGVRSVRPSPVWSRAPGVVTVVVSTMPASITDVGVMVENDGAPASPESPIAVPCVPTPAKATDSAKYSEPSESGTQGYAGAERNGCRCNGHRRCVQRHNIGGTVHDSWIVLRHIHYLRISWFNDNSLRGLLNHFDLGRGLKIARGLRLGAHYLYRGHHIRLLVMKCLAKVGCPCQISCHIIQHRGKLG